jgi:4-hydroxy-tetrahydrodipicolinate reductase
MLLSVHPEVEIAPTATSRNSCEPARSASSGAASSAVWREVEMRIGVLGCAGRMGRANLREVLGAQGVSLSGGVERPGHAAGNEDLGTLAGLDPIGLRAGSDAAALIAASDVVIEFSTPEASLAHARLCADRGCAHVVGTTGLDAAQDRELQGLAQRTPIVRAANMSLGVNLLLGLVRQVAGILDETYDIEIVEIHHRHKVDAPSGTALALGRAAAAGRGVDPAAAWVRARDGVTGPRAPGSIGFAVLRGGDAVGDHTVMFAGEGERIELTHKASDRRIYARGALRAARWAVGKPAGLYGMADVLGLS